MATYTNTTTRYSTDYTVDTYNLPLSPNPRTTTPTAGGGAAKSVEVPRRNHREVRFGAYVLGSTLGEGEFGKVKLGWRKDGGHPSQVAIKLIRRDTIVKDSESEIKVYREINALRLLNHPNIVNLVEVLKSSKYIGIVLEYASGGELFDYILKQKYLKENVAKKLFAQLVSGVDYMHSKGLVHRDLKLENLLLDKHKNIIISDFGFVNSYNKAKNDYMKTSCGSPCYAAPELVLTQSPYAGRKVDIWSLGVILYAMLAGYLPFDDDADNEDGADIVKLYNYICSNALTFPEYVSPLARDLLRKIIVPNPAKRIGMDEIRNHPWLSPYANLLSIRQSEWDTIVNEDKRRLNAVRLVDQNKTKRYSMFNETTSSSTLMLNSSKSSHGRSYASNSNIIYSSPTTSSSFANVVALPSDNTLNHQPPSPASVSSAILPSTAKFVLDDYSPSKSAQVFQRGHSKSASMSGNYPSASHALKAIVSEHDKPAEVDPTVGYYSPREELSRASTYTGNISTIVESPRRAEFGADSTLLHRRNIVPPTERLPHAQKRPRPTSYHPSSMTSSLSLGNASSSVILDYMKISTPVNPSVPSFLSGSPTKSLYQAESVSSSSDINIGQSSPGSSTQLPARSANRRNSVVTAINVNGVLTSDTTNQEKRSSVLNYLEDRMEVLELTDSHSPTSIGNSEEDKAKAEGFNKSASSVPSTDDTTQLTVSDTQAANPSSTKQAAKSYDAPSDDTSNDVENHPNTLVTGEISRRERHPETKEMKDTKKKNRFSILSFYNSSNLSSQSLAPSNKKVLEPSNDANVPSPASYKGSNVMDTSINGGKTRKVTPSPAGSGAYVNGKEAGAARKVMNFFKRRSVRIGS